MTTYKGSCHCGNVAYEVDGTIDSVLACNCSICQRKGSLLWFVPESQFRLQTPAENTKSYQFNKHRIDHLFCTNCGIHSYATGKDGKGNTMAAINTRCLEGVDPEKLTVKHIDGASM